MSTESKIEKPVLVVNVPVKLTKSSLKEDKEAGLTTPEMAKKYGLTSVTMSKALKMAGLQNLRAKSKPKFIIEDDSN